MSLEANKALIRRWLEEGDNLGRLEVADEIFAPEFVCFHPAAPEPLRGPGPVKALAAELHAAFAGYGGEILDMVAEGDRVTVRWRCGGVHRAPFMGIEATGRTVSVAGISIYRVAAGQVVEAWYSADMLGLMQQLQAPVPATR